MGGGIGAHQEPEGQRESGADEKSDEHAGQAGEGVGDQFAREKPADVTGRGGIERLRRRERFPAFFENLRGGREELRAHEAGAADQFPEHEARERDGDELDEPQEATGNGIHGTGAAANPRDCLARASRSSFT